METVAGNYLRAGDLANAAQLYTSLEHLNPKYARMARSCRVLNDPASVPLPHRHHDICEALLDPMMPPEILVGEELSVDAVQKRYQRLVVHAHPDKNPHPKAADAFLRLGELRERAVGLVEKRRAEKAEREAARQLPTGAAVGKPKRKAGKAAVSSACSVAQPDTAAPAPMPNLKDLRNTRITLSSLRRKELDDAALADTHLSATQRPARHSDLDLDDDDDDESAQLASTVPDMAKHRLHTGPSLKAAKGRPTSHNGKRLAPLKAVSTAPWTDAAPSGRDLLARRAGAVPKAARSAVRRPTPPGPRLAPPVHHEADEAAPVPDAAVGTAPSSPSSGLVESVASASQPELERSDSRVEKRASAATDGAPDSDDGDDALIALREQISSLIDRVGTMKRNSGGIRLTADLSYASYERQKETEQDA